MAPVLNLLSCPAGVGIGDSDSVVPYVENWKVLYEYYMKHNGDITLIIKEGAGHHPHGLNDNGALVEFVNQVYGTA